MVKSFTRWLNSRHEAALTGATAPGEEEDWWYWEAKQHVYEEAMANFKLWSKTELRDGNGNTLAFTNWLKQKLDLIEQVESTDEKGRITKKGIRDALKRVREAYEKWTGYKELEG